MSCGVGRRRSSDPALWLWCRPSAIALIRSLAWEPPYATGEALKRQKTKKKKLNFKIFILYWSIVDLQCVNFRYTAVIPLNIYSFFFRFFPHIGYYRILSVVPCAVQQAFVDDLFYR